MIRQLFIVFGFALAASTTSHAQLSFEHQPGKDPYRNLFSLQADRLRAEAAAALRAKQAEMANCVNYSMRVAPANPAIDPKIRVVPPANGVQPKIRTVTPPTCKPE